MNFLEYIEKLQKKPKSARFKILVLSVFVVMAAIIAFWIPMVRGNFNQKSEKSDENAKTGEPFNLLMNTVKDGFENLKKQLEIIK